MMAVTKSWKELDGMIDSGWQELTRVGWQWLAVVGNGHEWQLVKSDGFEKYI